MNLHKHVFIDLLIKMLGFGICIGILFPFFCLLFGVEKEIALSFLFFVACIGAGIAVGLASFLIVKFNVKKRLLKLNNGMLTVNQSIIDFQNDDIKYESPEDLFIESNDSGDCFSKMTESFNTLVKTQIETLHAQKTHYDYIENLNENLDLSDLSNFALKNLMEYSNATAGAMLIEKNGDLILTASNGFSDTSSLETNKLVFDSLKNGNRSFIEFPDDIYLDGVISLFKPSQLIVEPIIYNSINIGVLIMASASSLNTEFIKQLDIFVRSFSLILNNALQHEQMQLLAALDPLTGVYNRRFGLSRLKEECSRSTRFNSALGIMMIDIDKFKLVNDTYGHIAGDRVIKAIVYEIQKTLRNGDILVRYGGEEFLVILPGANNENSLKVADRIRFAVSQRKVKYGDNEISVNVSIGIDSFPESNIAEPDDLIKNADTALYTAKNTGRNKSVLFHHITDN